jgi:hypothetical protein
MKFGQMGQLATGGILSYLQNNAKRNAQANNSYQNVETMRFSPWTALQSQAMSSQDKNKLFNGASDMAQTTASILGAAGKGGLKDETAPEMQTAEQFKASGAAVPMAADLSQSQLDPAILLKLMGMQTGMGV